MQYAHCTLHVFQLKFELYYFFMFLLCYLTTTKTLVDISTFNPLWEQKAENYAFGQNLIFVKDWTLILNPFFCLSRRLDPVLLQSVNSLELKLNQELIRLFPFWKHFPVTRLCEAQVSAKVRNYVAITPIPIFRQETLMRIFISII